MNVRHVRCANLIHFPSHHAPHRFHPIDFVRCSPSISSYRQIDFVQSDQSIQSLPEIIRIHWNELNQIKSNQIIPSFQTVPDHQLLIIRCPCCEQCHGSPSFVCLINPIQSAYRICLIDLFNRLPSNLIDEFVYPIGPITSHIKISYGLDPSGRWFHQNSSNPINDFQLNHVRSPSSPCWRWDDGFIWSH